jgi:hypothetical protein
MGDPAFDMQQIDDATHHILPEEAWYGAGLALRTPAGVVPRQDI